jgi:hypothetical protein
MGIKIAQWSMVLRTDLGLIREGKEDPKPNNLNLAPWRRAWVYLESDAGTLYQLNDHLPIKVIQLLSNPSTVTNGQASYGEITISSFIQQARSVLHFPITVSFSALAGTARIVVSFNTAPIASRGTVPQKPISASKRPKA